MDNQEINVFLLSLREEGYDFYTIEEALSANKRWIDHLADGKYSATQDEFIYDMEFREDVLKTIQTIIKNNIGTATNLEQKFLQDLEDLDKIFHQITIPTPEITDELPFWYNRVLKKASRIYAEDVKLLYGFDVEIVE